MSVTWSDEEQAAAAIPAGSVPAGASGPQVARARDQHDTPPGDSDGITGSDGPWSLRAGKAIRRKGSAAARHPGNWEIWDLRPASLRVVGRRASESPGWDHESIVVRWPARAGWVLLMAWAAVFLLLAVAPRNKTCWLLAGVAFIAWMTW